MAIKSVLLSVASVPAMALLAGPVMAQQAATDAAAPANAPQAAEAAPAGGNPPIAGAAAEAGEIVVTAQKRTENLRDTPVSVAVVSPTTLAKAGVQTIDDLGKAVPALVALPATTTLRPFYTLRGISTNVITVGSPSGVAVMLDGVTLAPESLAARQLSDIASAEVLRGPQSTLGGRTASIGVINIVTRKPTERLQGEASGLLTTDGQYRGTAFVSGPITDGVAFTLSGFGDRTRFVTRNLTTGDHDRTRAAGIRGKLQITPVDDLVVTLSGNYVDSRDKGAFQAYIYVDPGARFRGLYAQADALPGITPQRGNTDYNTIATPGQHTKDQLYSLSIDYTVGDFTLSSVTARSIEDRDLRYETYLQKLDFARIASNGAYSWNNIQRSQLKLRGWQQEFRVASRDLGFGRVLAGLYYDSSNTGFQFDRPAFGTPIPFGAYRAANNKSYAAYGRVDWKITGTTTLITGLRYNRDKIGYIYNLQYNTTPASSTAQFTRTGSNSFSTLVGDATLQQKLGTRANIYAKYSRGYKPKIYNLDATVTPTNTFLPVRKEKVDSYELGFKGDLVDRLLTLNIAAFYTTYKNFQVQSVDPSVSVPTFSITNAGKASTRGVEVDATSRPARGLTLNASAAFVDAKYDSFTGATCYGGQTAAAGCTTANGVSFQDLSGKRLSVAPRWKFTAGADQRVPLGSALDLLLGGVVSYTSKINYDPNKNPLAVQSAYAILNLSAGLATRDDRYSLTVFVNNVTDKLYLSNISDIGGRWGNRLVLTGWYARDARRYAGVRAGVKF